MEFLRKIKGLLLIVLLPALLFLMGNAVFNMHVHKMGDGHMVVHAHPFQKSGNPSTPGSGHTHSCNDCVSIQQITSLLFVFAQAILLALLSGLISRKLELRSVALHASQVCRLLPNRAPPVLA